MSEQELKWWLKWLAPFAVVLAWALVLTIPL
jgi:hypothetical protein